MSCAPARRRRVVGRAAAPGRAVPRRSPTQVSGHSEEVREPDWISHTAERSALYLLQSPRIFYRSGLRRFMPSDLLDSLSHQSRA